MEQGITVGIFHTKTVLLMFISEYFKVYNILARYDVQQLRFVFALQLFRTFP